MSQLIQGWNPFEAVLRAREPDDDEFSDKGFWVDQLGFHWFSIRCHQDDLSESETIQERDLLLRQSSRFNHKRV